jgi:hypothetical protein
MTIDQPRGSSDTPPPPDSFKEFFRQHGAELLTEGKRSLRRVGIAALVIAITLAVALLALIGTGIYAMVHATT